MYRNQPQRLTTAQSSHLCSCSFDRRHRETSPFHHRRLHFVFSVLVASLPAVACDYMSEWGCYTCDSTSDNRITIAPTQFHCPVARPPVSTGVGKPAKPRKAERLAQSAVFKESLTVSAVRHASLFHSVELFESRAEQGSTGHARCATATAPVSQSQQGVGA